MSAPRQLSRLDMILSGLGGIVAAIGLVGAVHWAGAYLIWVGRVLDALAGRCGG